MQSYCVLIKNPDTEKQKNIETLKAIHGFTDEHAIEYSKNNPGFLAENVTYEKASEILTTATQYQTNVIVIETKNLPSLGEPQIFKKAVVQPTGFTYKKFVAFDRITLLAAGVILEKEFPKSIEEIRKELTSQIEFAYGQKTHPIPNVVAGLPSRNVVRGFSPRTETNFYLDIFFNKFPYHIRMKSDDFDYSYLEKRKNHSSLDNFRTFLYDISAIALKSYKNKTIDALITKQPLYPYKYPSISAYEKELLWLLTLFSTYH